jgi:predicted alpha/beta hydrolase family esterase
MKNAIILHGRPRKEEYFSPERPSQSNSHWLPWLQNQLIINGILTQTPEIYKPYEPRYESWAAEIERYKPDTNTLLVGHSCGAGMIIQWLSKNLEARVGKVVLVAPWIDVEKDDWPAFDFKLDTDLAKRTKGLTIFHSDNDDIEMQSTLDYLKKNLKNFKYCEFHDYGHFTTNGMKGRNDFPELLDECIERILD